MFQVIDGIQVGFVWTNYLPSSRHQVLLSSPIPVVLKLEHVSGPFSALCQALVHVGSRGKLGVPTLDPVMYTNLTVKALR